MKRPESFDPIGPGTPAWNAFDKAILAWRAAGLKGPYGSNAARTKSKAMKAYFNWRAYMVAQLKKHHGNAKLWLAQLDERKDDMEYEI